MSCPQIYRAPFSVRFLTLLKVQDYTSFSILPEERRLS
jgi:hypothetical protein